MKGQLLNIAKQLENEEIDYNEAKSLLLYLFDVSGSICTYPKHPSFDEVKCRTNNEGCSGCKYYR